MKISRRIVPTAALLLLLPVLAPAASAQELPPRAARLVEEGDEAVASGDLIGAIRRYERANRAVDGGSIEVILRLIRAYKDSDQYEQAIELAAGSRQVAQTEPEQAELATLAGRLYFESAYLVEAGDEPLVRSKAFNESMDTALTFFVHAGRTSPQTVPEVFYLIGRIYELKLERDLAVEFYVEYLKREPGGEYAELGRTRLQYLQGAAPPVFVEGDVVAPQPVGGSNPDYTDEAERARISGKVIISTVVDQSGETIAVEVVKGLPYGLSEAAREAVEGWTFEPAKNAAGEPIAVYETVETGFSLTG